MRPETDLAPQQVRAIARLAKYRSTILVAATGEGKTVICLSAIKKVIAKGILDRVIVSCPARVLSEKTWSKELARWEHLKGLLLVELRGDPSQRSGALMRYSDAQVLVVSTDNLEWLLNQRHGAEGIIVDEISKAAGKQTRRMNTKRWGGMLKWRIGLTASPVDHDFMKLFYIAKRIDGGKAFGTNFDDWRHRHFTSDYMKHNWFIREGGAEQILKAVKKLVHRIADNKASELPPVVSDEIRFSLPKSTRETYEQMKRDMVVGEAEAVNMAVRDGKLRQIASGFLYYFDEQTQERKTDWFFDDRPNAMMSWKMDLEGRRGIIFYEYMAQLDAILQQLHPGDVVDDVSEFLGPGRQILVAQIKSLSHGIDGLQHVCHDLLFYHPMWSRESYLQALGRVQRRGQKHPTNVTSLICNDTLDDVAQARVEGRAEWMELLVEHLEAK